MFTEEQVAEHNYKIEEARQYHQTRAAFGSILRKEIVTLTGMTVADKVQWLLDLGLSTCYATEINKEVALSKYEIRINSKR